MALVSVADIKKSFSSITLFEDVSFAVERGEKCGLVGRNGAGKTTLCRILIGEEEPDEGAVHIAKNSKIAFLTQFFKLNNEYTVHEELVSNFENLFALFERVQEIAHRFADDHSLTDEYAEAWDAYERAGGLTFETEIKRVLSGLSLTDLAERKIGTLSGGERMRAALAKILLARADLVILDEPTNHLDIQSVNWLTGYLKNTESAVILISHDRYVLDNVTQRIFDLDYKSVTVYSGNYSHYKKQKDERLELRKKQYNDYLDEKQKLEEYVRKYKAGNRATMAKSREKRLDKLDVIDRPTEFTYKLHLNFNGFKESGNDVLRLRNLKIRDLFTVEQVLVRKGDKVGIVGLNGSGKTSLFRALQQHAQGVHWGQNVRIAYFDQHLELKNNDCTMSIYLNTWYDLDEFEAREVLGHFHFSGDDAFKTISMLSGGERARFKLLTILLEEPNVIIMDEPTNHLDIDFLEIIETGLADYQGTVLVVSHDRYFLRSIMNSLWVIHGGKLASYHIEPATVLEQLDLSTDKATVKNGDSDDYETVKKKKNRQKKLERDLEGIEEKIAVTERAVNKADADMIEAGSNAEKVIALSAEKEKLLHSLDDMYKQWETIHKELSDA